MSALDSGPSGSYVPSGAGAVISARGVSKRFLLHRQRATSLKERLLRRDHDGPSEFMALRDVNLDVAHGETVGLIGANGSGKSTLLKVLAGILQPTSGDVAVQGRVASLLELGAGFNGELSGRDNVYLNAALLGLSRREIDGLYDSIVEFAELRDRMEDPVKHYSSGMYVKLGFAIAIHVDPDILLVDEVLAVGDEAFQRKCLDQIRRFQEQGRTILFVSHSLGMVEDLCTRAVVLNRGRVHYDGDPAFATGTLRGLLGIERDDDPDPDIDPGGLTIDTVEISHVAGGPPAKDFLAGERLNIRVHFAIEAGELASGGDVVAVVMGAGDIPICVLGGNGTAVLPDLPGAYAVDFTVPVLPGISGSFIVSVAVNQPETSRPVAARRFHDTFSIEGPQRAGLLAVPHTASISTASISTVPTSTVPRGTVPRGAARDGLDPSPVSRAASIG